jgi:hypothetical protein
MRAPFAPLREKHPDDFTADVCVVSADVANAAIAADKAHAEQVVSEMGAKVAELMQQRDAYKKAKEENDERFTIERDQLRAEKSDLVLKLKEVAGWLSDKNAQLAEARGVIEFYNSIRGVGQNEWDKATGKYKDCWERDRGEKARAYLEKCK